MSDNILNDLTVSCPYCGESFQTVIDFSGGDQDYYEDCPVCCRPILFRIASDDHQHFKVNIHREDD